MKRADSAFVTPTRLGALLLVLQLAVALEDAIQRECFLQLAAGVNITPACLPTTDCFIDYLGSPRTPGEWWLAYASAVTEYCTVLGNSSAGCTDTALCTETYRFPSGAWKGQPMAPCDILTFPRLTGDKAQKECWPNWEKIIRHPCIGCEDYQMFQCASQISADDCSLFGYCESWPIPSSGEMWDEGPRCWPKWMLHEMYTQKAFVEAYGPVQPDMTEYVYDVLRQPSTTCRFWNLSLGPAEACVHGETVSMVIGQLHHNLTDTDGGLGLLYNWSRPYIPTPAPFTSYRPDWPYYVCEGNNDCCGANQSYSYQDYPAALLRVHQILSMPWANLEGLLEQHSTWRLRLAAARSFCGLRHGNCSLPGQVASAMTGLHVLQQYCDTALSSTCNATEFAHTRYVCQHNLQPVNLTKPEELSKMVFELQARRTLGLIWLLFGVVTAGALLTVELLWCFAPYIRAKYRSQKCAFMHRWMARCRVDYHPRLVAPQASIVAHLRKVPAWRRLASRAQKVVLACSYVADIALDLWTIAALVSCGPGSAVGDSLLVGCRSNIQGLSTSQWQLMAPEWRFMYAVLLILVFGTQFLFGALLATPTVLATHGLLNYNLFKMTHVWRVVLLLPPTWLILLCAFAVLILAVILLGVWYLLLADLNMILTLLGVPPRWLLSNRLNMKAVVTLRFLCEGIIEALPAALISTTIINSELNRCQTLSTGFILFWLNLASSLLRVGREVYKLLRLTHDLHVRCFMTAIVDVCYHLQPQIPQHLPTTMVASHTSPTACSSKNVDLGDGVVSQKAEQDTDRPMETKSGGPLNSPLDICPPEVVVARVHNGVPDPLPGAVPPTQHTPTRFLGHLGCCGGGSASSNGNMHPKILVVYVWVIVLLFSGIITYICLYVVCPGVASAQSECGSGSLISVWSNIRPLWAQDHIVSYFHYPPQAPDDAIACLLEVNSSSA